MPPHTHNHTIYALGISYFSHIYSIFESNFRSHLEAEANPQRVSGLLQKLHIPELERTEALERDIKLLLPPSHRGPKSSEIPRLEAFKKHIQSSLAHKPHLLFAYTWIFYMALFSGGRYIRSKLQAGLAASITSLPSAQLDVRAGLSFWDFPGEYDGEDLKLDYKSRVAALSSELTDQERADIVTEGVQIMVFLIDLVKEVAETVPSQAIGLALEVPASDFKGCQGPVARIRPPWILLMRSLFPMHFMDILSTGLGVVVSRAPERGNVKTLPVQL